MSNVNHPNHYQSESGLEVIDVIKAFTADLSGEEAFCIGNAIKYLCRYNKKNGVEDLSKAEWYIERAISIRKKAFPKILDSDSDVQDMNKNRCTHEEHYKENLQNLKKRMNAIYGEKNFSTSSNKTDDFSPFEFECVICYSREEAGRILKSMRSIISEYGHATLADLHDLCGIDIPSSIYNQVGWKTVNHFRIIPRGHCGWELIPTEFDYVENPNNDRINKLVEQAKHVANSTAWATFSNKEALNNFETAVNAELNEHGYVKAYWLLGTIERFDGICRFPDRIKPDSIVLVYNPDEPGVKFEEPYFYSDDGTWGVLIPLVEMGMDFGTKR